MSQPIPFKVTRFRCPHCPRTGSSKARIAEHIGRCWTNPEARGCKTCEHYDKWGFGAIDVCTVGVDLSGQKQCPTCLGIPDPFEFDGTCPDAANHEGDGTGVKPGPIVHCDKWQLREEEGDA